ncbi:MAG TPA: GDSL-type esterase/lipase family protein, partial [Aggregatilineales bacterium]|nr:GDSL-type esterase/lipase family protein [Aggregatilineales bacterium]
EDPALLSAHIIETDENGFRLPAMRRDSYADYPIVALGDSYTDAWMVALPWTDILARELNTPVLNLAYRGYGTLEEAAVLDEYGTDAHQWVLLGFFEGNDLLNIGSSSQEQGGNVLSNLVREALEPESFEVVESEDGNYRYPLALYIGADYYELAFFDFYIWILNAERELYEKSRNLEVFSETLHEIQNTAGDACVGVVYMPDKAHIYFQYAEPFGRRWILEHGIETQLNTDGWIDGGTEGEVDFESLISRMDNQRDAVKAAVEAAGLYFIDLTPAFQESAAQSHMLYLTYDTHWNQAGHELAGQVVADYLRGVDDCEIKER